MAGGCGMVLRKRIWRIAYGFAKMVCADILITSAASASREHEEKPTNILGAVPPPDVRGDQPVHRMGSAPSGRGNRDSRQAGGRRGLSAAGSPLVLDNRAVGRSGLAPGAMAECASPRDRGSLHARHSPQPSLTAAGNEYPRMASVFHLPERTCATRALGRPGERTTVWRASRPSSPRRRTAKARNRRWTETSPMHRQG